MDMTQQECEAWLREELAEFRNGRAGKLNGRFGPELVSCDVENREIVLRFPLQSWQENGLGTLHGGIACAMMDLAMCVGVYCFSRTGVPPTVSMTVNYLRPVPMKDCVLMKIRVTSLGHRNATAYCEAVIPESGKPACTALGTYAVVPGEA